MELKAFAIQAVRKIELGASQVQKAFHIDYYAHALILKFLVHRAGLVVKIQLVAQARAPATRHGSPQAVRRVELSVAHQVLNFLFGFIRNGYHNN